MEWFCVDQLPFLTPLVTLQEWNLINPGESVSGVHILPSYVTRFCIEWAITSWGESSRCRMPQHASSPEPDVVTTLRRCCVSCAGIQFSAKWSSNSPVWCVRHCVVRCLPTWLMISVSSLKATDGPSGLPLTTCVRCHVRTTASETEALELPARKFGIVCHTACEHLTLVTNILKRYWKHICLTRPWCLVTFICRHLRNILTYLLTFTYLNHWMLADWFIVLLFHPLQHSLQNCCRANWIICILIHYNILCKTVVELSE